MDILRAIFIVFGLIGMLSIGSCMMIGYGTAVVFEEAAKEIKKSEGRASAADSSRFRVQSKYQYEYDKNAQERAYDYKQNKLNDSDWKFGDPGMDTQ
jgi:hypothetical protein